MKRAGALLAALAARAFVAPALAEPAPADVVRCHVIYGGEEFAAVALPAGDPYTVEARRIGRYFEFKVAYITTPAEYSALSVYVYATASGEPVLIHEAKFPVSVANGALPWGFTGLQSVYEPSKSSELQYWCEKAPGDGGPPAGH
jgi:hypothetical protein